MLRFKVDKLEEQIDTYWKQRAHVNWLMKGDRNTTFFHNACKEGKRHNRIGSLRKEYGGWVESEVEKQGFISNHFKQLFRSNSLNDARQLLDVVALCVTREMNETLLPEFREEEVVAMVGTRR